VNRLKIGTAVLGGAGALLLIAAAIVEATPTDNRPSVVLAQIPYQAPPKSPEVPDTSIPPNTEPLTPEEMKRAEALVPLLSGNQELWAMGEFVHLGSPALPVLVKALKMPDPRLRYNAIETIGMIKDPWAAPALVESAMESHEKVRVREHALRVAVRLNPTVTPQAIETMAKDPHDSIRRTAAFQGRYVREKAVIPVLIDLLKDEERIVAITAIQSLWILTRHESVIHDWHTSTHEQRIEWSKEWVEWWETNHETFEIPEPRKRRRPL
jgi:HEAT repeat protein